MRFYEVTTSISSKIPKNFEEILERGAVSCSEEFFSKHDDKAFIFIVSRQKKKLILGAALLYEFDEETSMEELADEFLEMAGIVHSEVKIQAVTLEAFVRMINCGYRNDYLKDDDETFELIGLGEMMGFRHRASYHEYLDTETRAKKELIEKAKKLLCRDSVAPEIERIFKGGKRELTKGHPVHYVVQSDSYEIRRQIVKLLFEALRSAGRVKNPNYFVMKLDGNKDDGMDYDPLYKISRGGMAAIDYTKKNDKEDEFARPGVNAINDICRSIRKYKHEVQTVICLPRSSEAIQDSFLENLEGMTFLPLREEIIFGERAKQYLRQAAKNVNVTPDKNLYDIVKDSQKGFLSHDLNREFDRWFTKTLKTRFYPQYNALGDDAVLSCKKKPGGSAYQELESLIGLADAKGVIRKAVNYYKAQTIFRDKGMKYDNISMHMIFTGNPGSAKTTAARLFARIMKENGLLSKGDIIEVGRGDLVGKYVGWTAQIVKSKFRAAQGSVLFIDEAYSLVDDKQGMYGDEAINTIVQEMENNREDLAVIFAGYPDKMEDFLRANPGLRSRIAFHVPFADYSPPELYEILELMARKGDMNIAPEAREKLARIFESASRTPEFGNGRFVRNLYEKAKMNQTDRIISMDYDAVSDDDLKTLTASDFEMPPEVKATLAKAIGFAA